MIKEIQEAVSIPVMAKVRIGHFVESQILEAIEIDYIDESEVLSPADDRYHIDKTSLEVPFVCGAKNLGEALRRIFEGASMIRSKGEPGTGDVIQAVRRLRRMNQEIALLQSLRDDELYRAAKELQVPYELVKDNNGEISGGPMYYILNGMGKRWKPLAVFFAVAGVLVAYFGIGTFSQVNSITSSLENSFGLAPQIISVVIAVLVAIIIFGGIQSISKVAEKVVPFMAIIYIIATLAVIFAQANQILPAFGEIFSGAFTGTAAIGGFAGTVVKDAIQKGIARGVFSNESGLGSAPIAAAAAKTEEPVEQGLISMTGTFIDTIIICTLTGLSVIVTGKWTVSGLEGAPLTQAAFSSIFGTPGAIALTFCLVLFAFTTILGWSYYGERCFEFLFGTKHIKLYRSIFVVMVALGGFLKLELIWVIADIVNGLMALPNLIALLALSPVIIHETKHYFAKK